MKVKDIMTTDVKTCTPDTTVAEATHLMWDGDCGFLPVVDDGELVGVVTDRDLYIALGTKNERASVLKVGAVATTKLATCVAEDDVNAALATMKQARVRRLPVVGYGESGTGHPVGERHHTGGRYRQGRQQQSGVGDATGNLCAPSSGSARRCGVNGLPGTGFTANGWPLPREWDIGFAGLVPTRPMFDDAETGVRRLPEETCTRQR